MSLVWGSSCLEKMWKIAKTTKQTARDVKIGLVSKRTVSQNSVIFDKWGGTEIGFWTPWLVLNFWVALGPYWIWATLLIWIQRQRRLKHCGAQSKNWIKSCQVVCKRLAWEACYCLSRDHIYPPLDGVVQWIFPTCRSNSAITISGLSTASACFSFAWPRSSPDFGWPSFWPDGILLQDPPPRFSPDGILLLRVLIHLTLFPCINSSNPFIFKIPLSNVSINLLWFCPMESKAMHSLCWLLCMETLANSLVAVWWDSKRRSCTYSSKDSWT